MTIYKVQGPDGKVYRLEGPEGASEQEVIAQAQTLGGAQPATQAPAASGSGGFFEGLLGDKVSDKSLSDLVTGGKPKVVTREDEIRRIAKERVDASDPKEILGSEALGSVGRFGNAALASAANTFGIGPRVQAAISAVKDDVPYDDALAYWRDVNKARRDENFGGNIAGAVVGGAGAGLGAGAAVTRMAASASPAVAGVGNVLQQATQLVRGQRLANAARIAGVGGAAGAAQAAGEGTDIGEGAVLGAAGSSLVAGAGNALGAAARQLWRPVSGNVGRALREIIGSDPEAIAARHTALSARAGSNVPLVAALPERDFQSASNRLLKDSPEAVETASDLVNDYRRGMMGRMSTLVRDAGRTAHTPINTNIEELARFRENTADNLMAPIEGQRVDLTQFPIQDLERRLTQQAGGRVLSLGQRVEQAIGDLTPAEMTRLGINPQTVTEADQLMGRLYGRNPVDVTVREAESLRRLLNAAANRSARSGVGVDAEAYRNASQQLRDFVSDTYPAYGQMVDTYAGQSRMMEGFEQAAAGKRIQNESDVNFADNLRSQEGQVGMRLGELYRLHSAARQSPSSATNLARDLGSNGAMTRPRAPGAEGGSVTENIGPQSSERLAEASQAQYDVDQRLLEAGRVSPADQTSNALDTGTLAYGATLLTGPSMLVTKARVLAKVAGLLPTGYSRGVAQNVTEMLFSGDPAQSQQAINLLRRTGVWDELNRSGVLPVTTGAAASRSEGKNPSTMIDVGSGKIIPNPDAAPGPQSSNEYETKRQDIIASQPPEFANLLDRMEQQESGGRADAVSSKGARNVMQVMPPTGPDAAKYAGVPFDEELYKTDPEYGRLLGAAYMAWLLPQFDGDVAKALAAYNDGPADAKVYVGKPNWLSHAPKETRDYVKSILG